jgi:thiamine-monophosphate kinase
MLDRLPLAPSAREAAQALDKDALEWATGGGEDYELLLTCDPAAVDSIRIGLYDATGTTLTVIGRVEQAHAGLTYVDARGEAVAMRRGYQHFDG